MSIENNDSVTMIGLHTLESLAEGGMLPQLQALASRPRNQWTFWNVVAFPADLARAPGSPADVRLGPDARNGANVLTFCQQSARPAGHSRKA